MNLTLLGHDDRYAVEQLQLALFPEGTEGEAVSSLRRSNTWLTATTRITVGGKTAVGIRRLKATDESVRERRRTLQQSYYKAAVQLLNADFTFVTLAGITSSVIAVLPKGLLMVSRPSENSTEVRDVQE